MVQDKIKRFLKNIKYNPKAYIVFHRDIHPKTREKLRKEVLDLIKKHLPEIQVYLTTEYLTLKNIVDNFLQLHNLKFFVDSEGKINVMFIFKGKKEGNEITDIIIREVNIF
jgi:hypothetical protein